MPRNSILSTHSSVKNQRLSAEKMFQGYITPVHAATRYIPLFRQLVKQTIQAIHVETSLFASRFDINSFIL